MCGIPISMLPVLGDTVRVHSTVFWTIGNSAKRTVVIYGYRVFRARGTSAGKA